MLSIFIPTGTPPVQLVPTTWWPDEHRLALAIALAACLIAVGDAAGAVLGFALRHITDAPDERAWRRSGRLVAGLAAVAWLLTATPPGAVPGWLVCGLVWTGLARFAPVPAAWQDEWRRARGGLASAVAGIWLVAGEVVPWALTGATVACCAVVVALDRCLGSTPYQTTGEAVLRIARRWGRTLLTSAAIGGVAGWSLAHAPIPPSPASGPLLLAASGGVVALAVRLLRRPPAIEIAGEQNAGRPFVVLRGFLSPRRLWTRTIDAMTGEGCVVATVDLPWNIGGVLPWRRRSRLQAALVQLTAVLDELATRYPDRQPMLVGHSFGGGFASWAVPHVGARLAGIILINPVGIAVRPAFVRLAGVGDLLARIPGAATILSYFARTVGRDARGAMGYFTPVLRDPAAARLAVHAGSSTLRELLAADLPSPAPIPVAALLYADDELVHQPLATERLRARGARCEVEQVGGHNPMNRDGAALGRRLVAMADGLTTA